jgi:hypothetical protein
MESVPPLSSHVGPGRVQLEGFGPTRNRKVGYLSASLRLLAAVG